MKPFLPTNKQEMKAAGWDACDIIFVTGDAYCDHPGFGTALLSRYLESKGFRCGIIAQPDWKKNDDFLKLGQPRLFFGVTAGNLDSMLALYTPYLHLRKEDRYSPGGATGLRPKLPSIVYTSKCKSLFAQTPVIIGGLEASLRRLAYYDFWTEKVRRSLLFDSKADLLVYGMAERQVLEIASRLGNGEKAEDLKDIRGTVVASRVLPEGAVVLPSYEDVSEDKKQFLEAYRLYSRETNPYTAKSVAQKTDTRFCLQLPPAMPLSEDEMDELYGLPFSRRAHPSAERFGGLPALRTVETSIVSHRGCAGSCSFCSLSLHQGRVIQSRSPKSILAEAKKISRDKNFKGTISDVGGPTANMYAAFCAKQNRCFRPDCLWPRICPHFKIDHQKQLSMLGAVRTWPGVKKVNIQSGVRFDLLLDPKAKVYLEELCRHYVSGQLKIAPEHVANSVLCLMRKPAFGTYRQFVGLYQKICRKLGKDQYLAQYFITSHPGCGPKESAELADYARTLGYRPEQVQDFIPLPMTASSVMYHTGLDPETGKPLYVPRGRGEREHQRRMIQGQLHAGSPDSV